MSKKQNEFWVDNTGELNSWDDLIDELKVQYRMNAALNELLYRHKVSVKDIASVLHQAKSEYYGWKKETKFKPTVQKKIPEAAMVIKKKSKKNARKIKAISKK